MTPHMARLSDKIKWLGRRAARATLDTIAPPTSLLSNQPTATAPGITASEWAAMRMIQAPQCRCCGIPFPYDMGADSDCLRCQTTPPVYQVARAAVVYDDGSKPLLLAFKHADRTEAATLMAQWMHAAGAEALIGTDVFIPVPLHHWRLLRRRYNQSALLAHDVARRCALPCWPDALLRRRATPPQGKRTRQQRLDNVRGAFALHRHADVRGRHIVLVDDVMTTGATVSACTQVLLAGGAASVRVLTFAMVTASDT